MNPNLEHPHLESIFVAGNQNKIDLNPKGKFLYTILFNNLHKKGFKLSHNHNSKFAIFVDFNPYHYKKYIKSGGKPENMVLLRFEPVSVLPSQYNSEIMKMFGLVLDFGKIDAIDNLRSFHHPYMHNANPLQPEISDDQNYLSIRQELNVEKWAKRANKIVLIASNKLPINIQSGYYLRRKWLANFNFQSQLTVFGTNWQFSLSFIADSLRSLIFHIRRRHKIDLKILLKHNFLKLDNYAGFCEDKNEILRDSKFNLIIENSFDTMTEKFFDSIIAGSIPIYIGPPLNQIKFLGDSYIQFNPKTSPLEILHRVDNLSPKEIQEILDNINQIFRNNVFQTFFSASAVMSDVTASIVQYYQLRK